MPVVASWDGANRRINLSIETVNATVSPVEIYREYRIARRTDESLRKWSPFMQYVGNVPKGGGKATPRYMLLLEGAKIVPYDASGTTVLDGEILTDDQSTPFDYSLMTNPVVLQPSPADAEIVFVEIESPLQDRLDYLGVIHIDTVGGGTAGSTYPAGTNAQPVDNYADAIILATTYGINKFDLSGTIVIGANQSLAATEWTGNNPIRDIMVLQGSDSTFATMTDCTVTGLVNGRIYLKEGSIAGNLSNFSGGMVKSVLAGSLTVDPTFTDAILILQCASGVPGSSTPFVDINSAVSAIQVRDYFGGLEVRGMDQGQGGSFDITGIMKVDLVTCTSADLVFRGDGRVLNAANGDDLHTGVTGSLSITNYMNSPHAHAEAVWQHATRTLTSGGAGGSGATPQEVWEYATRSLTTAAGVTAQDITDITDAVWSEPGRSVEVTLSETSMLTAEQNAMLKELWQVEGLDPDFPMTATRTTRVVDAIIQIYTGDRKTSTTATRQ